MVIQSDGGAMYTFYKGFRIATEVKNKFGIFEIYQGARSPQPNRFEGTGFVMEDFGGNSLELLAAEQAKDMIDANFETPVLQDIRKISKY